jgi:D-beta-D-heptose 7-phosphate kinase/D-beta-D-heptose 1-phosphate adenosyltransferase
MTTVWTNGCFDVLHRGHVEMFRHAKSLGDKLIVGVDTDEKVKAAKGSDRPFNRLGDRMLLVSSIRYVDEVYDFGSKKELEDLIKSVKPDILIVGSDWRGKEVVGSQYAGRVEFFDRVGDYSTTKILEKQKF